MKKAKRKSKVRKAKTAKKKTKSATKAAKGGASPAKLIDEKIKKLGGWRGKTLAHVRAIIRAAEPGVIETVKWRKPSNPYGVPVWEYDGILCTGETYKDVVKLTFARGASLPDPSKLFNASLEGNLRRAIDIREDATIHEDALKTLVQAAVVANAKRKK